MPLSYTDQQIREQAVFLGLIENGAELPRHLRGKVVATMVQTKATERAAPTEPQLAQTIVIQPGGTVLVDGEPFPWLITRQPMEILLDPDGTSTVRLTLMAAAVQIVQPEPRPESE
ncbi:hypothetical protein [Streptomyces sp. NPDC127040]|uniref:hypothetical protein n=1 Tax=Streptomyces sp. NPDC127040 TaxID=3347116 RepID=UPI00366166D1